MLFFSRVVVVCGGWFLQGGLLRVCPPEPPYSWLPQHTHPAKIGWFPLRAGLGGRWGSHAAPHSLRAVKAKLSKSFQIEKIINSTEIQAAEVADQESLENEHRAVKTPRSIHTRKLHIIPTLDTELILSVDKLQGLAEASDDGLSDINLIGNKRGKHDLKLIYYKRLNLI